MAKVHGIHVYAADTRTIADSGLVGEVMPEECVFEEEKNGVCQLTIKLPYDDLGRWKAFKVGNIVKAAIPVRVPPAVYNGEYLTEVKTFNG